jgi:uncharacterized iron-regulated membrane protein
LCLTGLPLIFHHELEHLLGDEVSPQALQNTPLASVDEVVRAAHAQLPSQAIQYLVWDRDEPLVRTVIMASTPDAHPDTSRSLVLHAQTAKALGEPKAGEGLMFILLKLHVDMFAGLAGKLLLGGMGVLFLASLISGAVVYGPFMRKLRFGTVRHQRSARIRWLDLHNLLGIVTLTWALVVGATGALNATADLLLQAWRADQLAAMIAPYAGKPALKELGSLERAVASARVAAPGMSPSFVAFPGTAFSSGHHYTFFMRGETPLTARLLKPVLIDAQTAALTSTRDLPWYLTALLVSQPLHFGDYGGLPMKIVWAVLDIVTIIVLLSGLYLWFARRTRSGRAAADELMSSVNSSALS